MYLEHEVPIRPSDACPVILLLLLKSPMKCSTLIGKMCLHTGQTAWTMQTSVNWITQLQYVSIATDHFDQNASVLHKSIGIQLKYHHKPWHIFHMILISCYLVYIGNNGSSWHLSSTTG